EEIDGDAAEPSVASTAGARTGKDAASALWGGRPARSTRAHAELTLGRIAGGSVAARRVGASPACERERPRSRTEVAAASLPDAASPRRRPGDPRTPSLQGPGRYPRGLSLGGFHASHLHARGRGAPDRADPAAEPGHRLPERLGRHAR